jgi:septal ring factor EnvC (AmiA/AmiB activator)
MQKFSAQIFILLLSMLVNCELHADPRAQLTQVNGSIEELKQSLNTTKTRQTDLETSLKASELTISKLGLEIKTLDKEVNAQETELRKLKQMQQHYQTQLASQRSLLAQQIRLMYLLGHTHALQTLLNPQHMHDASRQLTYYHYLSNSRLNLIAEINQVLDTLETNLARITDRENKLKNLLAIKQAQQHQQQLAQTQRQNIILELNRRSLDKMQQLQVLTANQFSLKNLLASFRPKKPEGLPQAFALLRGKLEWPTLGHRASGYSAFEAGESRQAGVVINAPQGAPVQAIYGGKVIFANWLRGFGLLLIINHGDGFMSLYARNEALYAKLGETVKPNQVIASIGNTGGYNKPSLYFEIRHNGLPVNPSIWCR